MNGGVIFLAIRSSQLIGEKKEWYLSSSCRERKILDEQTDRKQASSWMWFVVQESAVRTYKIILHSQPLGAVLLQEPLQQLPACV